MSVDAVITELIKCQTEGRPCVLAVLVKVEGSTPRHVGTKMLVLQDGQAVGTIGGGALEAAVIKEAEQALAQGKPRLLSYDLRPDLGMMCGGRAMVYLEPQGTPPRLFIFGAGHIALALYPLAVDLGFQVTIVDERLELANEQRFPGAAALVHSFDPAQWEPLDIQGEHTYCVVASAEHKVDTEVVAALVERPLAYLGMIGSRNKRRKLERELAGRGVPDEKVAAVRSPMGLPILAETPLEIAVSIVAELIQTRRRQDDPAA